MRPPWARFDDLVEGQAWVFDAAPPDRVLVAWRIADVASLLAEVEAATAGGAWAYGYVAYESAAAFDPALTTRPPVPGLPLAWFVLTGGPRAAEPVRPASVPGPPAVGPWTLDWDEAAHAVGVEAVREAIAAGETYQVNLTTRLRAPLLDVGALPAAYADLALAQRGAYNAYLDLGSHVVVSASPELFVQLVDGRGESSVLMRPMKGTAARGRSTAEDAAAVAALLASEKERAENVMIVDLVRHDLHRVAVPGSVAVPRLCAAERYETVHQLTSDVTAQLRPGLGLAALLAATFPCGSVTGAPKARTMELIAALEEAPRGVYCGAIGMVAPPGGPWRARFSVAIRTIVVDVAAGEASYGVGGGITWSSNAAAEYAEVRAKAAILDVHAREFALVETMRHVAGSGVWRLERHLARLADSAAYCGFAVDEARVRAALTEAVTGVGDARVRLVAHRDGRVEVEVGPLPDPPSGPVQLALDDVPVESRRWQLRHKTTRRRTYDEARARHPGADDVLLVNERGEITESTIANVAVRLGGRWWTPPVECGLLPGIERGVLVAAGRMGERVLTVADVRSAEEIVLVSALRGWRPAALVAGRPSS